MARDIWLWCKERSIFITVSHISGKLNIESDMESRKYKADIEWELNGGVFYRLTNMFPGMEVDMFASRLNNKIGRYFSWKPDPFAQAFHVD